jgi:hypothetical protein
MGSAGLLGSGFLGVGALNVCLSGTFTTTCNVSVTVSQLIGLADTILSGGTVSGLSAHAAQGLITSINEAYDDCKVVDANFILQYLQGSN